MVKIAQMTFDGLFVPDVPSLLQPADFTMLIVQFRDPSINVLDLGQASPEGLV